MPRSSVDSLARAVVVAVSFAGGSGCAAEYAVKPAAHDVLPEGWNGRSAFCDRHATLLSRDAADAQDAADLAASAAADFRTRTGREPSARLLLVTGSVGWMADTRRRLELGLRGRSALAGEAPPSVLAVEQALAELQSTSAKLVLPPDVLLSLGADVLAAADIGEALSLSQESAAAFDWCIILPTRDEQDAAVEQSIDAAMRTEDVPFLARMLSKPFMPMLRGALRDTLRAQEQGLCYAAHAAGQPDWNAARRRDEAQAYLAALTGAVDERLALEAAAGRPPE
jgi:hypothetical protein